MFKYASQWIVWRMGCQGWSDALIHLYISLCEPCSLFLASFFSSKETKLFPMFSLANLLKYFTEFSPLSSLNHESLRVLRRYFSPNIKENNPPSHVFVLEANTIFLFI